MTPVPAMSSKAFSRFCFFLNAVLFAHGFVAPHNLIKGHILGARGKFLTSIAAIKSYGRQVVVMSSNENSDPPAILTSGESPNADVQESERLKKWNKDFQYLPDAATWNRACAALQVFQF